MTVRSAMPERGRTLVRRTYVGLGQRVARLHGRPDFVVIGAQRCGTTTLFRALSRHPQLIRPTFNKGVNYFDLNYYRGWDWYCAHFPLKAVSRVSTRKQGHPAYFESSGYYLYHPDALERLARDMPDVKIVVMLRDPVERAYSAYEHERARGFETEDFERALELEDERLVGEVEHMRADLTYESLAHRHHSYRHRGHYAEQLTIVYEHFERDQTHVMLSEDFFAHPERELRALTDFLGVAPLESSGVGRHNARPRAPMREETRQWLTDYYEPHDEELESLLGMRVTWRAAVV